MFWLVKYVSVLPSQHNSKRMGHLEIPKKFSNVFKINNFGVSVHGENFMVKTSRFVY